MTTRSAATRPAQDSRPALAAPGPAISDLEAAKILLSLKNGPQYKWTHDYRKAAGNAVQ